MVSQIARGCHHHNTCTTSYNGGQNAFTDLDRKFLSLHSIGITVLGFNGKISLDLDQFYSNYQRDSGLAVVYGEYFELTIDFGFDCGHRW